MGKTEVGADDVGPLDPLRRRRARSISFLMQDAEHESVAELTFIWDMCDTRMLTRLFLNCAYVFQAGNGSHLGGAKSLATEERAA